MNVLVITGKLAAESVKKHTKNLSNVDMLVLPITVASFMSPQYLAKTLRGKDLSKYDMLLLPGMVNGDVTKVEETTGIPTYKGPIHLADLPLVLNSNIQLSKTIPATELIQELVQQKAIKEIELAETNWKTILQQQNGLVIGKGKHSLPVSDGLPMRVIGEIVNAPNLNIEQIKKRAKYYETQGAEIIDIGMLASNPQPEIIPEIIKAIRETVNLPISIDTLNPTEIKTSINTGIDLILSIDSGNIEEVAPYVTDETIVILPTNMKKGILPKTAQDRVKELEKTIKRAQEHGAKKIIGDLVIEPLLKPGLMEGLKAYQLFKQRNPSIQLLFGIGNAVELIDADTPGVFATLSALARETGANILHVPEHSVKAIGSVKEAVKASHMMFLAEKRGTLPKDLGLDLLILKEKRWKEDRYTPIADADELIGVSETMFSPDKKGWCKIQIDRDNGMIVATHYPRGNRPVTVIKGKDAREVYQTIIRQNLISKLDHAAYLGKELEKAAIALKLVRSYQQDMNLF